MKVASASIPPTSGPPHRFSVERYHRMIETGVLTEDDRVELLNGEIVDMSPIGKEQIGVVDQLARFFQRAPETDVAIVRVQNPVVIDDCSEPEPDLTMLRFRPDFYRKGHAGPADVILLIEVADTSLANDRRVKVPLYARAGIAEVWVVDLNAKLIEVNRNPVDGKYLDVQTFKRPAAVASLAFPSHPLKMDELFPD